MQSANLNYLFLLTATYVQKNMTKQAPRLYIIFLLHEFIWSKTQQLAIEGKCQTLRENILGNSKSSERTLGDANFRMQHAKPTQKQDLPDICIFTTYQEDETMIYQRTPQLQEGMS